MYNEITTRKGGYEVLTNAQIKEETIKLYDQLPDDEEGRKARIDIRDKVIDLNYKFFGYVATHTFVNNPSIGYEDKFQSALTAFLQIWYLYRWKGHYRCDLSFAVFFKPRISEMVERENSQVKYSLRRTLLMKVGEQLGIYWPQVKYEDLQNPNLHLSADDMNSLKAIFGSLWPVDPETTEIFVGEEAEETYSPISDFDRYDADDNYDSIVDLLIHEMSDEERNLDLKDLKKMSKMYDIPLEDLQNSLPEAKEKLYQLLKESSNNRIWDDE